MQFVDAIELQVIGYAIAARMVAEHDPVRGMLKTEVFHFSTSSFPIPPVGERGSPQGRADRQ